MNDARTSSRDDGASADHSRREGLCDSHAPFERAPPWPSNPNDPNDRSAEFASTRSRRGFAAQQNCGRRWRAVLALHLLLARGVGIRSKRQGVHRRAAGSPSITVSSTP